METGERQESVPETVERDRSQWLRQWGTESVAEAVGRQESVAETVGDRSQ